MSTFQHFLDQRDEASDAYKHMHDRNVRNGDLTAWLNAANRPEVRLLAFDRWAKEQLAKRLDWGWAGDSKEKRIEQCRIYLERLVLDLWRRGWMLDGKRLAGHIEKCLDAVGTYQRAGKVANFWAYFQASVDRYVGGNAEEIREEAMRVGSHVGQVLKAFGVERGAASAALPALVAQRAAEVADAKEATLREKQSRLRAKNAAQSAAAQQPTLF